MTTQATGARSARHIIQGAVRGFLAAALACTLMPFAGMAGSQAHAAEDAQQAKAGPQISITAPFWITFASADAPYDVADPQPSITAESYFKNGGSEGLTLYSVECLPPDGAGADLGGMVLASTNAAKPLTSEDQKVYSMWDKAGSDAASIDFGYYNAGDHAVSAQNGTMDTKLGVEAGQMLTCAYRLNLSNNADLAEAAIKESAALPATSQQRQPLGTFKFTFSAWYPTLGFGDLTGLSAEELAQVPFFFKDVRQSRPDRQEIYSLTQMKDMSARLSAADAAGNRDALYDDLYEFIKNPDGYECYVRYNGQQVAVRLLGLLQDTGVSGQQVGFTFQFADAIDASPLGASLPASAATCTWPYAAGTVSEKLAGEYLSGLEIAADTVEVRKTYARNATATSATQVGNVRMRLFLPSRFELGGQNAMSGTYTAPDGSTQEYNFTSTRPWIAREGTGKNGQEQYQLYAEHAGTPSANSLLAHGSAWWTRTPWPNATTDFSLVDVNGGVLGAHQKTTEAAGIVPCFCL